MLTGFLSVLKKIVFTRNTYASVKILMI